MTKRFLYLLLVVLASGLLAAGCGDDDDDGGGGGGGGASTEQKDTGGGGGANLDSDAAKAAKQGCEAGVKNNAAIEASKRDELSKECQKVADAAATGDKEKYKAAYSDFCNKLAEALPAEARDAAKSSCKTSVDAIQ